PDLRLIYTYLIQLYLDAHGPSDRDGPSPFIFPFFSIPLRGGGPYSNPKAESGPVVPGKPD
ncbi:MAG: hypothetical protein ABIN66_05970, partial [candidate division WOR-3 bacterium]